MQALMVVGALGATVGVKLLHTCPVESPSEPLGLLSLDSPKYTI